VIEELLHEVIVVELATLRLFFWLCLSAAIGLRRHFFIIVTFCLFGSDDLHSLLLGPSSLLELLLQIHCLFLSLSRLRV
jgi:hypothetical protein